VDSGQPAAPSDVDDAEVVAFGGLTVGAFVLITLAGFLMYQGVRPVRSAHSDDPSIEAFTASSTRMASVR
jgi:hypothetical protein